MFINMLIKKSLLFILVFLFCFSPAYAVTLKLATLSPDGSLWMDKMREGAQKATRLTDGRIKFKFYPAGVMGDDQAVLRKIRIGQLHGGAFISGSLAEYYFKDVQIYGLPLIFESFEQVDYVRERMDPLLREGLEKGGFHTFGIADGGFAQFMSQNPVATVSDLKNQKVWIPENNKMVLATARTFGVTPIPLTIADVRTGLQTGLIDAVTTSPIGAVTLQWHTQVQYLTNIHFMYLYGIFGVDKKAFSRLSEADRKIIDRSMGEAFGQIDRENRKNHFSALETLKNQGIEFIKPTPDALKQWKQVADNVPEKLIREDLLSKKMLDTLYETLSDYRLKNE